MDQKSKFGVTQSSMMYLKARKRNPTQPSLLCIRDSQCDIPLWRSHAHVKSRVNFFTRFFSRSRGFNKQVKEVDFTYFQNPAAFDVNIALLVLQLSPTNFSDVAREMSVIVPDNVAPARDDVQKLTDKMKEPTIDAKGIRRIFRQLMGMALTESTCGMLAEGTTMAVLVRQMTKFVAHVDVALYGGWTLMHMAATSVPARHALVAHGGLQVLHAAARQHAADLGVQSHFALTLGFMAQSDIAVEVAVVGTLVDALQQHVGDAQLQLHCIRALTCIHTSTTNADVLSPATLHTKVIAALKSTISAYPSDSITATAAKTCVESLQRSGI
eukprot:m.295859 g.295859  ORF g.295859 m.295859 type:complete len:327 (-) comp20052_c1_seq2:414-1394(-)